MSDQKDFNYESGPAIEIEGMDEVDGGAPSVPKEVRMPFAKPTVKYSPQEESPIKGELAASPVRTSQFSLDNVSRDSPVKRELDSPSKLYLNKVPMNSDSSNTNSRLAEAQRLRDIASKIELVNDMERKAFRELKQL